MDGFEQMCKDAGVDDIDRLLVEPFYIEGFMQGLRRAAEIAREYQRAGARVHDSDIEREASKLEREGT